MVFQAYLFVLFLSLSRLRIRMHVDCIFHVLTSSRLTTFRRCDIVRPFAFASLFPSYLLYFSESDSGWSDGNAFEFIESFIGSHHSLLIVFMVSLSTFAGKVIVVSDRNEESSAYV